MKLENLIEGLSVIQLAGEVERKDIGMICYDSRKVVKNSLFVAIKGFNFDGHDFIMDAISKGATVVVLEDDSKVSNDYLIHQNVTKILVKDSRKALAHLSKNFFKNPSEKIQLIGVTGTNGKTSVTYFVKSILEKAGYKSGLIGTIANYIGDEIIPSEKTTPESVELNQLLERMVNENCKYCSMEVSSHSLELHRVYGLKFKVGVFTNLSQDHLDFHGTMENYFLAKKKLFDYLDSDSIAVVNFDDKYGREIIKDTKAKVVSYGSTEGVDYRFVNPTYSFEQLNFDMIIDGVAYPIRANVTGTFNVYNLTASIAVCHQLGIDIKTIQDAVNNLSQVPGRFEVIGNYPVKVIVDYAHTHDALENVLLTIREILKQNNSKSRVITVFGAGGDRDKTKRPKMAKVVEKYSDYAIITSDNPRNEDVNEIFADILSGIYDVWKFEVIEDRDTAIMKAIVLANPNDVVLIAGKGHETYQIIKNEKIPFDDRLVAKKHLRGVYG
ncbi:MAG: UDP-N-acetylmuramoyl-L-alanyl-D-glutamate--2,6-diaminopimelate ligase [Ignavibacteria bacterium]|nr:UDP-N-acetylmuramoyl-L-alanyl-D-glutamate--2,6-diaminopimelate ligase [Ignavibacteria bacterium]